MSRSNKDLLQQLISMVEAQGKEIQALRLEVRALKGKDPTPQRARIEPDMGWEYIGLRLDLDAETWLAIKNGAHVSVKGHGYADDKQRLDPNDPDIVWDYWEFSGGIGHRLRVSLASSYAKECDDDIEEIYDDVLSRGDIEEY